MNKINSTQLFVLTFFLSFSLYLGFGIPTFIAWSGNASLITSLIGTLIGLVILLMILKIADFTNFSNIFKGLKEKNKIIGHILNFLFVLFAIFLFAISSWIFINFVISEFLTRESYYFFAIPFFLVVAFMVSRNIEVIGRVMFILFIFSLVVFLIAYSFLSVNVKIDNLFPIFDVSLNSTLKSTLGFPCFSIVPIFFILIIGKKNINDKKNYNKAVILGYLFSCFSVIAILFFVISVYGVDVARLFSYPSYSILKKIHAFNFIERIENVLSIIFYSIALGSFGIFVLFIKGYFKELFKITSKKIDKLLVYLITVFIPIITIYIFEKLFNFDIYKFYPLIAIGFLGIIFITFIFAIIKKKQVHVK